MLSPPSFHRKSITRFSVRHTPSLFLSIYLPLFLSLSLFLGILQLSIPIVTDTDGTEKGKKGLESRVRVSDFNHRQVWTKI